MQEYPVQVGSMLFTMVDPHRGHEVAYNRWYERDHFYAGCLTGPWLFAGSRWVATRPLKDLRFPEPSSFARPHVQAGSYLAFYWIHAGHHDEHRSWASQQARWLYEQNRGFHERTHVHTLFYKLRGTHYRDADPVPLELSPDHRFAGLVTLAIERAEGVDATAIDAWFADRLPSMFGASTIASCSTWSPLPQGDGPMPIPRVERADRLDLQLYFLDAPAEREWDRFVALAADLRAAKLGEIIFASPWRPTVVGTDIFADELW